MTLRFIPHNEAIAKLWKRSDRHPDRQEILSSALSEYAKIGEMFESSEVVHRGGVPPALTAGDLS